MIEWIVMAFFIGVPLLLLVGAGVAMVRQRRETFRVADAEPTAGDLPGSSPP
ncbi:hypothetical protein [Lujinxingia sediminis]|uniref:hypothetical protein n=1 Tax=Lujinxingia sediminis TaxID=2480984 RepID=UPI0013E3962E|nr:hypothetical protein [Lujinxingia sediminis]